MNNLKNDIQKAMIKSLAAEDKDFRRWAKENVNETLKEFCKINNIKDVKEIKRIKNTFLNLLEAAEEKADEDEEKLSLKEVLEKHAERLQQMADMFKGFGYILGKDKGFQTHILGKFIDLMEVEHDNLGEDLMKAGLNFVRGN